MTTNASKALKFVIIGSVAAAAFTGCSSDTSADDNGDGNGPARSSAAGATSADAGATRSAGVNDPAFTAISTVEANGGKVVGLDRVDEGARGYHVEVLDGQTIYEVEVDTAGKNPGDRVKTDFEPSDLQRIKQATVPLAEALKTAQAEVPGKDIDEAVLDGEGNAVTWDVELDVDDDQGRTEIQIDASTGEAVE